MSVWWRPAVLLSLSLVLVAFSSVTEAQPTPGVAFAENFDGVTAPALPPGWVANNALGPDPAWVTDTTGSDTMPNAAHVDDPLAVSDKRLDSPPIYILTDEAELHFYRTNFFCFQTGDVWMDGGVLEIAIDGGPFQDILDAGGSASYTGQIVGDGNPLQGRHGWIGNETTDELVVLPPVGGHTIVLRWRMGSSGGPCFSSPNPGWWIDSIKICDGAPCNALPVPKRLDVDTVGNGVWEVGEAVDFEPFYYNNGSSSLDLSGTMTMGGLGAALGIYEVFDNAASYGSVPPGALGGCVFTADCYVVHLKDPGVRLAQHWDAQMDEVLSNGQPVTWALHVGGSFTDVPSANQFYYYIETLFHRSVTGGCGGTNYCPDNPALRKQMAVFLLKSKYGSAYVPPPAVGIFADVPASDPFAPWIENLYNLGITGGCSAAPLNYCPNQTVLRKQMAVFLLKTLNGSSYVPPACQSIFGDVACPSQFADWIEALYNQQITGGCGGGNFCPDNPNTRGQMAVFLGKTFGLTLYGP